VLISDSFNSVGINQVRDQIVLNIKTKVKVAIPFYDSDISCANSSSYYRKHYCWRGAKNMVGYSRRYIRN